MLKAVFAMAFVRLTFNSAYAERISIGQLTYRANQEAVTYFAIIIDHSLDIVNQCAAHLYPGRPAPVEVACVKLKYHSQLPAGANTTSVFMPLVRPAVARAVAELVGIEGGVVSGVINLESSGVEASDWRPRHDEQYHDA